MKKKVLAALVVVAMISSLALIGCGKKADPNVGVWKATEIEFLGIKLDVAELYEDDMTLELKDDGACLMSAEGEVETGTWSASGKTITIVFEDTTWEATVDGSVLTLTIEEEGFEMTIVFEKQ
ncbi:MAG: lipocalin family protein [Coriobacteriia bacterium]|nr:lipocalin family protein [Coriobacteriia bacterium]